MAVEQFRITDSADQQFDAILNGKRVTIRLRYNPSALRWFMDVSISATPVLNGRRVVSDVDLLEPFNLGIGVIFCGNGTIGSEPSYENLVNGNVGVFNAI